MSKQLEAIDFQTLVTQVTGPDRQWGQDRLAIWGGNCDEKDTLTLLQKWPARDKAMPYRIWEYVDRISFEKKTLPGSVNWLQRGRLFGPGGDLTLRRDSDRFIWYFVGAADTKPPDGEFDAQSFWDQPDHVGVTFYQRVEYALLWGERRKGFDLWFEDRTGRAKLKYPWEHDGRVQMQYQTFSRAGRVEFVWLLGLEDYNG